MRITREDMERYGHKDDWGVDCLYLHDAQRLFADKLREAAEPLIADAVATERKAEWSTFHGAIQKHELPLYREIARKSPEDRTPIEAFAKKYADLYQNAVLRQIERN